MAARLPPGLRPLVWSHANEAINAATRFLFFCHGLRESVLAGVPASEGGDVSTPGLLRDALMALGDSCGPPYDLVPLLLQLRRDTSEDIGADVGVVLLALLTTLPDTCQAHLSLPIARTVACSCPEDRHSTESKLLGEIVPGDKSVTRWLHNWFCTVETVRGCSACSGDLHLSRQLLQPLPPYIVLDIRRVEFCFDIFAMQMSRKPIETPFVLDMQPALDGSAEVAGRAPGDPAPPGDANTYGLRAVVVRDGTATAATHTVYVATTSGWYACTDTVTPALVDDGLVAEVWVGDGPVTMGRVSGSTLAAYERDSVAKWYARRQRVWLVAVLGSAWLHQVDAGRSPRPESTPLVAMLSLRRLCRTRGEGTELVEPFGQAVVMYL